MRFNARLSIEWIAAGLLHGVQQDKVRFNARLSIEWIAARSKKVVAEAEAIQCPLEHRVDCSTQRPARSSGASRFNARLSIEWIAARDRTAADRDRTDSMPA